MTNLIKCILVLSGLMASSASVQLPSSTNGFLPPSPFYFYNPATLPTLNSHTSKHEMTYYDYPTSTLLESHIAFLSTCMKDLKDSNQKLAQTSKLLEELKDTSTTVIETLKNDLNVVKQVIGNLTTEFTIVKQDVQSSKSNISDLTTELTKSTAASSIGKMPGSCGDLQRIGHNKSGLFSIMESNKIVNVYCDFTKPSNDSALQKWIGHVDVKSLPTYFYVQKSGPFGTSGVPIPFELERLNIGGAMNITTGKFSAPRKGVYFFAFNAVSILNQYGFVNLDLMVNGVPIGRAQCDSKVGGGEWETLTLQSTIELKAGDSVWLQIASSQGAFLQDNTESRLTHFSGWMLQESLSL